MLVQRGGVDRRGGGGVGAGRADENRGDGAAVLGTDIGRGQQHDRRHRLHAVGERQQQGHGDRGRDAGKRASQDAPEDRKSDVEGKSVSVGVEIGGGRNIKKKDKQR